MKKITNSQHPLLILMAMSLILSVPSLWVPYYNIDELTNSIYAKFLVSGELSLKDFLGNTYLLTHYVYKWVGQIFGLSSLVPIHAVHALWKCATICALYFTGKELHDRRTGIWAALFYCYASVSFMSKDFHTPSAESFSLLPATLAVGFFFRAMNVEKNRYYFLAGIFTAIATLFKAPMGITIVVIGLTLVVRYRNVILDIVVSHSGFALGLFFPMFLIFPFGAGVGLFLGKLEETNTIYIQAYNGLSYLYLILKYIIRSALVFSSLFVLTVFALQNFRTLSHLKRKHRNYWQKVFFLFTWLCALGFAVSLGGRIFYHYYVFILAPLSLLAASGVKIFDTSLKAYLQHPRLADERFEFLRFVRRHVFLFLLLPALGFSIEGAFNFSTRAPKLDNIIHYIQDHTKPQDRIYVWGNLPQLYFFSERQPSTVYFWSDILAGTSPGSPAMEYVRATGRSLTVSEQLEKDFEPGVFRKMNPNSFQPARGLSPIGENELFTPEELLSRIDHPYWQKVFADFFKNPPELFVDTSPTNVRGFGHTPVYKYELLNRFVMDNYKKETIIDNVIIYRLHKRKSPDEN